jgi:ornithine decarboxylase
MNGSVPILDPSRFAGPMHTDRLYADARAVIRYIAPSQPAYLFCESELQRSARRFQLGFPGMVSYAVKANPNARVIRSLADQGISHFDVASEGEIELVASLCPQATLHFNNPVKATHTIESAYQRYGVRSFALDELAEFNKIHQACNGDPDILYSVRFKLEHCNASYDFGSKFGCTPAMAVTLLKTITAAGGRPALTFHPGSQCTDPDMYTRYLQTAADIANEAGVELAQLNVGGGFPAPYTNAAAPAMEYFFEAIHSAARQYFRHPPLLMCEPGRAMVASCVSLLTRVIHVRDEGHTLFINDGVYGGLLEQSVVDLQLPVACWREGRKLLTPATAYQVFGPTCDPVDRLKGEIPLPAGIRCGDYLEFGLLGAYSSATSTAFNGFDSSAYVNVSNSFNAC